MKKMIYFKTKSFILIAIAAMVVFSCSKDDDSYDIMGAPENRVFINTYTINTNIFDFNVVHTPVGPMDNVFAKFPVRSTNKAESNIQVTFALDNSIVDEYNEANNTSFIAIPQEMIDLSTNVLTIPQGQMISPDSLTITLTGDLSSLTEEKYMAPVKISQISSAGSNAVISSNLHRIMIRVSTLETNVYDSPTAGDITGSRVEDRSLWSVSASVSANNLDRILDTRTNRYGLVSPQEFELTVDLGEVIPGITGARIHSFNTNYSLLRVGVYSSTDGDEWVSHGIANLSRAAAWQYFKFYSEVEARYWRFHILDWVSSQWIVLAGFDLYQSDE